MKTISRLVALFALFVLSAVLSACATNERIVTVKETNTVVLTPPKKYLTATTVPAAPFTKVEYDAATWPQRAQYNANLNVLLYEAVGQCNADKNDHFQWLTREKANVEKVNKAKQ